MSRYPADEAASPEKLSYRQREAGEYFQSIVLDGASSQRGVARVTMIMWVSSFT